MANKDVSACAVVADVGVVTAIADVSIADFVLVVLTSVVKLRILVMGMAMQAHSHVAIAIHEYPVLQGQYAVVPVQALAGAKVV